MLWISAIVSGASRDLRFRLGLLLCFQRSRKALTMPTEHRIRFHQEDGVAPRPHAAGQSDQESALPGAKLGLLGFPRSHDELLPECGVFGEKLISGAEHVSDESRGHS